MDNQAGARQPYRIVTPPSAATMACKRAFDILCSFLGLTVLSPVLLVVSVLVAVTSPGGVFFRQERIGKDGKPFRIFKFRSMRKDNAGLKITTGNDSRITPVGRFLRKSKIDQRRSQPHLCRADHAPEDRPGSGVYPPRFGFL